MPSSLIPAKQRRPARGAVGLVLAAAVGLILAGCSETSLVIHTAKLLARGTGPAETHPREVSGSTDESSLMTRPHKIGRPYQVNGVWYYPREQPGYDRTGVASWYGEPFHGRRTANGEIYDMNRVSAAHPTLPLPTRVKVTNLENGRSIVVRVNDRGPFVNGRLIDLSRETARLLGMLQTGTAKVRVQAIDVEGPAQRFVSPKPRTEPAEKTAAAAAPIKTVTAETLPPPNGVAAAPPLETQQNRGVRIATTGPPRTAATALTPSETVVGQEAVTPADLYVQIGAFSQFVNANRLAAKFWWLGSAKVTSAMIGESEFFRVRIGPLANVAEADKTLNTVIGNGHPEARIVVEQGTPKP